MTEPDAAQQDNPEPVHHETLEEAAAEGPLPGVLAEEAAAERGEDGSRTADAETEADDAGLGDVPGGMTWPGE